MERRLNQSHLRKLWALMVVIVLTIITSSVPAPCEEKGKSPEQKGLKVVTTLFPLYDFARNIGKDKIDASLLLPPGVESHSFEPRPEDIRKIAHSDIFIYTGKYMEPWVEDLLKGIANKNLLIIDCSEGVTLLEGGHEHDHGKEGRSSDEEPAEGHPHEHGGKKDPHIWLDFSNAQKMVDDILTGFVRRDPSNKPFYTKNAEQYKSKLDDLDRRFKETLSSCKTNIFIHGGHFAFGYLAKRYGLRYISAYGFSPDAEPSPKKLAELVKTMRENGSKYIYYEELITPRVAEAISRETGATLLKLHGAHNLTKEELEKGVTFISLMEGNLKNLRIGLQCP